MGLKCEIISAKNIWKPIRQDEMVWEYAVHFLTHIWSASVSVVDIWHFFEFCLPHEFTISLLKGSNDSQESERHSILDDSVSKPHLKWQFRWSRKTFSFAIVAVRPIRSYWGSTSHFYVLFGCPREPVETTKIGWNQTENGVQWKSLIYFEHNSFGYKKQLERDL